MAGSQPNQESVRNRVLAELRRDPKKTLILGVMLGLLAIIGGWELVRRLGPSQAEAAVSSTAVGTPDRNPQTPEAAAQQAGPKADALAGTGLPAPGSRKVDRDLFTPHPVYFPPHQRAKIAPKIVPTAADAATQREALRRAVLAQAQSLTLQSTVVGSTPTAIVNGRVLRVGDWINGFCVVRISTHRCVVKKDQIEVILELSK